MTIERYEVVGEGGFDGYMCDDYDVAVALAEEWANDYGMNHVVVAHKYTLEDKELLYTAEVEEEEEECASCNGTGRRLENIPCGDCDGTGIEQEV